MEYVTLVVLAAFAILMFICVASALAPRAHWRAGEYCDIEHCVHSTAAENLKSRPVVYVMLCISTEKTLRAVLPGRKVLLAEIDVSSYQHEYAREHFATEITNGLQNAYGLDINPVVYTTPLAHNILADLSQESAAMSTHLRIVHRLAVRRRQGV